MATVITRPFPTLPVYTSIYLISVITSKITPHAPTTERPPSLARWIIIFTQRTFVENTIFPLPTTIRRHSKNGRKINYLRFVLTAVPTCRFKCFRYINRKKTVITAESREKTDGSLNIMGAMQFVIVFTKKTIVLLLFLFFSLNIVFVLSHI